MLPWARLTTLLITSISMKHCIIILDLAPHLVFCDLTFFGAGFDRDAPSHVALPYIKTLKLRGESSCSDLLGVLTLPALQRLHIDKSLLNNRLVWPDRISGLRSLLSQWGSIPQEIRIGFARRSLHMYAEVLPSAVFRYTRSPSRAPRITCSMKVSTEGTEAADIDEEGDWDEESHREEEEPDSDSEESSSEYSSVDSDDDSA
ncbi:hypothetical protein C8F04DRAFT_135658 [Mycena alexandri]|uniref:Uncharacterized protein n=1 Tax=Mycena alexandri TaxID=1745969 RepID=A0AAD6SCN1_9AGAR|nr:hypothetical protein C8F04DRAFT_135658 [Mycena alexandri]